MPNRRSRLLVFAMLVCLVVAGCTGSADSSDDQRHGGFYGGVSGGMTHQ